MKDKIKDIDNSKSVINLIAKIQNSLEHFHKGAVFNNN